MRINTNISAIISNGQLSTTEGKLSTALERLSSGYKINHSMDNPAGMAISQRMRSQIRGLDQADNNAQDGASVLQTAEGALTEIQAMLSRMKELSVQAANDVNSDDERSAIQQEIESLNDEIDRIAGDTDFNTIPLLDGSLSRRVYSNYEEVKQIEVSDGFVSAEYGITVSGDGERAVYNGGAIAMTGTITEEQAGIVTINGVHVAIEEGDTLDVVGKKLTEGAYKAGGFMITTDGTINDDPETAGYASVPCAPGNSFLFATNEYGSNESLTITCDNAELAGIIGIDMNENKNAVIGKDAQASFTTGGDGNRIGFANSATISTYGNRITVRDNNDKSFVMDIPGKMVAKNGTVNVLQEVTDVGTLKVHVGANENQIVDMRIPEVSAAMLGTDKINVYSHENASKAISKVDKAISNLASVRSKIGAYENRLDHTVSNLAVAEENLTSAISRIRDVDMAEEMTEYTSLNVMAQAGTSMLAQANARPETVLQLLQR